MGVQFGKFFCAITGAAFFLLADAVPTDQRTASPTNPLRKGSFQSTTEMPKIVWTTTENTRHETGGSEGCFGVSTGSGGANLIALSPDVVAITFPEYGCKGQPTVAVCGSSVADRLEEATARKTAQYDMREDDTNADDDANADDVSNVAPVSTSPSTSCAAGTQTAAQGTQYDDIENTFRGTVLQRPGLKTLGCSAKTSSIQYTADRSTLVSEPGRMDLEKYSSFMSLKMPVPAVAKSVFLARVNSLGSIPAIQPSCVPAGSTATEATAAVACPETTPAHAATAGIPAVATATPVCETPSAPAQTLAMECPAKSTNETAAVPATATNPALSTTPAFLPGPIIVSVPTPEATVAPATTAARMVRETAVPVVVVVDDD